MLMKKLMLTLFFSSGIIIPFVEAAKTDSVARQLIDVDLYEFKNYRNEMNEKVQAYEKYKIEEQKRIEAEQERLRQEELERQRIEEEKQRQIEANRIYVKFEVSFYTTAEDEGGYLGANGDVLQPWVSIATPKDIPFYSNVYIEELGNFTVHDTGSYIKWATDEEGNKVCRVDVCVNSKEEAYRLGRYYAYGYIDLNR